MKYIKEFEKINKILEYCKILTSEPYFSYSLKKLPIEQQEYLLKAKRWFNTDYVYIPIDTEYTSSFGVGGCKVWSKTIDFFQKNKYAYIGGILTPEEMNDVDIIENGKKYNL